MSTPASMLRPQPRVAVAIAGLVWAVLLLLPIGRTAELPLLIVAALALPLLWRVPRAATLALPLALIAAYAGPALLSAPDAVDPSKAWTTALGSLRFGLYALALVLLLGGRVRTLQVLVECVAALVALWTLDALVQSVTGWSLGGALQADRISGVFGADNLKLGPVLAVLSPFVLLVVRERFGRAGLLVAWLLLALSVLLAGARAGWVSFALVTLIVGWREVRRPAAFVGLLSAAAVAAVLLGALAFRASPEFAERVNRTAAALGGDRVSLDHALAGRLPIWETAWAMGAAHPFNGVGVRGFRHAYAAHAAPDDPWLAPRNGGAALHAHHWMLELWSETGLSGLLLWLAGIGLAVRAWQRADLRARERARAPAIALLAMLFPLNTHFAFYASFWGLLFWWLLALYAATLVRADGEEP